LKLVTINDRALVRLIPATYHKPPVLRGLVDSDEEAAILAELEGLTNQRLKVEREGSPALDRRELAFARRDGDLRLYGQTHINAAFSYTRAGGNRFNDDSRGAWYCAYDLQTSAAEVGYHRTRELSFIGVYDDEARYVELLADFIGTFASVTEASHVDALHEDPMAGYPAGQALARELRSEGHRGLLYPSVRKRGGRCFVAFDPHIVQNVRPGASWNFTWSGSPDYALSAVA
jgi:RES domain-containing protein